MKIASFNINNINRRLPNLLSWLREAGPRFRARWGDRPSIQS
jgi:exonuclease III